MNNPCSCENRMRILPLNISVLKIKKNSSWHHGAAFEIGSQKHATESCLRIFSPRKAKFRNNEEMFKWIMRDAIWCENKAEIEIVQKEGSSSWMQLENSNIWKRSWKCFIFRNGCKFFKTFWIKEKPTKKYSWWKCWLIFLFNFRMILRSWADDNNGSCGHNTKLNNSFCFFVVIVSMSYSCRTDSFLCDLYVQLNLFLFNQSQDFNSPS